MGDDLGDLREKFGKLQGEFTIWIENVKTQFLNLYERISNLHERTENIQKDLNEIKINVLYLKNNLSRGFWERFFEFAKSPKGSIVIIIVIISISASYFGIDKLIELFKVTPK